jgi:magnesium chelatase subunit I
VIPDLENAILSGHDLIILGERGQAKSRLIRNLVSLLDEYIPVIEGCEINDNPYNPVCRTCCLRAIELGDRLPVTWLHREQRYGEKLATPDASIADLFGELDPIKVAEGKYLSDERAIHFGLLPRSNRGIFAINELPDLAEKVQVGLFNILEERDVQIKGFKIRLPLDIYIVATANPEDYTHRGRIITPLKDRYSSQVRTHYPDKREGEIAIVEQEHRIHLAPKEKLSVPLYMKEIIASITFEARKSPEINQTSGVSVRMSISNYENIVANARKRALRLHENEIVPRISDLAAVYASSRGRIELEYTGEERTELELIELLIQRAIKNIFDRYFRVSELGSLIDAFEKGAVMEVSADMPSIEYLGLYEHLPVLNDLVSRLKIEKTPAHLASAAEFILEGLHLNRKLNKKAKARGALYQGGMPSPLPRRGPGRSGDETIYL